MLCVQQYLECGRSLRKIRSSTGTRIRIGKDRSYRGARSSLGHGVPRLKTHYRCSVVVSKTLKSVFLPMPISKRFYNFQLKSGY